MITAELRTYARGYELYVNYKLLEIADRIDREHRMAMEKVAAEVDALPMTDESMAEHGWVRLPVDADGVPIHVGDVMETDDNHIRKVDVMQVSSRKWSIGLVTTLDRAFSWHDADRLRHHHHAPTVEDVLREFADAMSATHPLDVPTRIAEYAAKLRLREDA